MLCMYVKNNMELFFWGGAYKSDLCCYTCEGGRRGGLGGSDGGGGGEEEEEPRVAPVNLGLGARLEVKHPDNAKKK